MPFPQHDEFWMQVRTFLERQSRPLDAILAPNEFMEFFPGNCPYQVCYVLPPNHFSFVVFHKGMMADYGLAYAHAVIQQFRPVFANEVFVVYSNPANPPLPPAPEEHVDPFVETITVEFDKQRSRAVKPPTFAVTITTYNRPERLERSLPQILKLGVPILVVDDASEPDHYAANQRITDYYQVPLLRIPENRGLPNALNAGIQYWLADPEIEWISYFQDDVDVHPDLLSILAQIQDPHDRPLLTGRDALEHQTFRTETIAGYQVLLKRSMPGQHLHAHRDYWAAVMPIPTPYLGAPKPNRGRPGQAGDEDWWVTAWAPRSITKRGGYVVCVPGLVRTFCPKGEDSTWGNVSVTQLAEDSELGITEAIAPSVIISPATPSVSSTSTPVKKTGSPAPQPLSGIHVLVDGYNLQMTSGTGIKTYSTSLIKALDDLGATVDVLLSRNSSKKNDVLDEVVFFDDQTRRQSQLLEWVTLAKGAVRSSSGPLYRARRRRSLSELVIKEGKFSEDFLEYARSFNLPRCYETANSVYKYFNRTTNIYTSEKIDIWHATYPLPIAIKGAKKVTTIHDLIPLRLPYTTLDDKEVFYGKVRDALRDSAITIAVSEHTKKDLLTYFDVDPDRIVVTYQPTLLEPLEDEEEAIAAEYLQRFKLDMGNYLLFVGAIEPKKNVGRLLEAYATIDTEMPLVIVGKKAWSWEDELGKMQYLFDKDSKRQVKMLEYVSTESLRYLYRGAYCFLFPSLYEGFGLPPVEAMRFGCPVITSQVASLPEVCGNGALYVNPYDVRDIKEKIEQMLRDTRLRDQLAENGRKNSDFFSIGNYANRLNKAYQKALT